MNVCLSVETAKDSLLLWTLRTIIVLSARRIIIGSLCNQFAVFAYTSAKSCSFLQRIESIYHSANMLTRAHDSEIPSFLPKRIPDMISTNHCSLTTLLTRRILNSESESLLQGFDAIRNVGPAKLSAPGSDYYFLFWPR
jgi:hypothetical protein